MVSTLVRPRRTRRHWRQYKSSRTENPRIWVQLGCNKTSRGFLRAPRMAIGAVKLQPVTSGPWTVAAEVASSSLVAPAIPFNEVIGRNIENSNPQLNPQFVCPQYV